MWDDDDQKLVNKDVLKISWKQCIAMLRNGIILLNSLIVLAFTYLFKDIWLRLFKLIGLEMNANFLNHKLVF